MEQSIISVDLLAAARRSDTFPQDWPEDKRRWALQRYEKFLRLAALHPGVPLAPTRDIDELWHLHMLSPRAYFEDCRRLLGRVLDHDGGFGKEPGEIPILQASFERTAALWLEAFGEAYVETGDAPQTTKCWHDCQSRCWHACSSKRGEDQSRAASALPSQ